MIRKPAQLLGVAMLLLATGVPAMSYGQCIPPSITSQPVNVAVCNGSTTTVSVAAAGTSVNYQWEVNDGTGFVDINNGTQYSGATSTTLTITGSGSIDGYQYRCTIRGACTPNAVSNAVSLDVHTTPSITTQPADVTICSGQNTSLSIAASGDGVSYQWQVNNGSGYTNISDGGIYSGATTSSLSIDGATTVENGFQYRCVITNACSVITSNASTLTVNGLPAVITQPGDKVVCDGGNTSFTIDAGTGVTYKWQLNDGSGFADLANGGVYSGTNTATLSIASAAASMSGYSYRCVVNNGNCDLNSNAAILTVNELPAITNQPADETICDNEAASFEVAASGNNLTYQWQEDDGTGFGNISNGGIYSGATSATLTITGATTGMSSYSYRCIVSGTCTPAVTSNAAELTVAAFPVVTTQPASKISCEGDDITYTVTTSGTGFNYQWQVNDGTGFQNITDDAMYSGATTATLAVADITTSISGYTYHCVVSNGSCSVNTNDATLTVNTLPTVTAQPTDKEVCDGGNTTFELTATGTNINYQWQVNTGSGFTDLVNDATYSNVTAPALAITAAGTAMDNYQYRCIVRGTCTPAAISDVVTLKVSTPISITSQPVNRVICDGNNTTFAVTSTGNGAKYRWQVRGKTGGFTNITDGGVYSGATTATLTITGASTTLDSNRFRCVVSNACQTVNSANRWLTVNELPAIATQPEDKIVCAGSNTTFTVGATGDGLIYKWQMDDGSGFADLADGGVYSGTSTATLSLAGLTRSLNNNKYRCIVSGTCTPDVTSAEANLTVHKAPAITTQPVASVICDGQSTSFSVTATGTALAYQWQVNDGSGFTDVTNGGIYSGAATSTLNITAASTSVNGYQYRCVLTNACTPLNSDAVALTVNALPVITSQPSDVTICETGNTTFTVANSGSGITYKWQVNSGSGYANVNDGGVYSGSSTATLTITGAPTTLSGYLYRCVLNNGNCDLNTAAANLTVKALPKVTVQPSSTTVCHGNNTSFSLTATGAAILYQWQEWAGTAFSNITDGGFYSGANTATLNITGADNTIDGQKYRCVISGTCTPADTSSMVQLTVYELPAITGNPVNNTVCTGTNVKFGVKATGSMVAYQWQVDDGTGFADISNNGIYSGANSDSLLLTAPTAAVTGYQYRCVISGICTPAVTSTAAMLTVNDVKVTAYTGNETICEGTDAIYNVTTKGVVTGYQWQYATSPAGAFIDIPATSTMYTGVNSPTLGVIAPQDYMSGYQYRCVVTGLCTSDMSTAVDLTVKDKPEISQQPADANLTAGDEAIFNVTAHGYHFYYAWQASTNDGQTFVTLSDNGNYSGTATSTLTVHKASVAQNGYSYRCVVRELGNDCNFAADSSAWAYLLVTPRLSVNNVAANGQPIAEIYPNPVTGDIVNLKMTDASGNNVNVRILNTIGTEVYKGAIQLGKSGEAKLDVAHLPAGVYTLYISNEGSIATQLKFVKQ